MGLSGALQKITDQATGALLGLPGGSELAVVTPPGGAPPVANVHVILRFVNPVVRQGRAGAQQTGAALLIRRANFSTRPVKGTVVETAKARVLVQDVERTAAWWKCAVTRVP